MFKLDNNITGIVKKFENANMNKECKIYECL